MYRAGDCKKPIHKCPYGIIRKPEKDFSPESYDYILANKSYFSSEGQGETFLQLCLRALKPGGLLQFTTKQYQWYANRMLDLFTDVAIDGAVHHFMLSGRKLENPPSEPDLEIEPLI